MPVYLNQIFQVFIVDVMLSVDNAVVIAMACRGVPHDLRGRVLWGGTAAAIVLRIILAMGIGLVIALPGLRLVGGVVLLWIAVKLVAGEPHRDKRDPGKVVAEQTAWRALGAVIVADLVMSLDNVLALASISQGNFVVLAAGVAFSIPLLIGGSRLTGALLTRFPLTVLLGGGLLGWIAGDIAVSDPLVRGMFPHPVAHAIPAVAACMAVAGGLTITHDRKLIAAGTFKGLKILAVPGLGWRGIALIFAFGVAVALSLTATVH